MSLLKKFLLGALLVTVLAFAAKEAFYAKKPAVTVKQEGSQFYYYPQLNTYYDVAANNFYYTLDGGETWIVKKPTSPDAPTTLGQKVVFFSQTPEVWKDNALHIEQYGGTMVNYVKEDSLIKEAALRDSIEKPKMAVVETVEKEPEVKGRFLKKLRQKIKNRLKDRDKESEEAPH